MKLRISPKAKIRIKRYPSNIVPTGCDAEFKINDVPYSASDYREKPNSNRDPHAIIRSGGEVLLLDIKNQTGTLHGNAFSYTYP